MVFMDGSNVYHGMKNYAVDVGQPSYRIDFQKFVAQLVKGRTLIRAIYYCSKKIPPDAGQIEFVDYVRKCGIQVIEKPLKERRDPATGAVVKRYEKGVDVALATDLLGMAWEGVYDIGIIVSGDADYTEAVKRLMGKGRNIELVSWRKSCSSELSKAALNTIYIDDFAQLVKL